MIPLSLKQKKFKKELVQACISGDINLVDSVIDLYENQNFKIFKKIGGALLGHSFLENQSQPYYFGAIASCAEGHLNLVRYLLITDKIPFDLCKHIDIDSLVFAACENCHKEIIEFLCNSNELSKNGTIRFNSDIVLHNACMNGHLDMVKYLLTSNNIKEHCDIHSADDRAIVYSFMYEHSDIADYLLKSPNLNEHANIHAQNDLIFKHASEHDSKKILEYLIFDLNIDLNDSIKEYLANNPNEDVERMFKIREMSGDLDKKLAIHQSTSHKLKKI